MKLREKLKSVRNDNTGSAWRTRMGKNVQQVYGVMQRHSFLTQIAMILCYRLILDVLYITVISAQYEYTGHTVDIRLFTYLCSWAAVLIMVPFLAQLNVRNTPSSLLVTCINYLYFIPLTSYFGCKGLEVDFFIIALGYWGLFLFWQFKLPVLYMQKQKFVSTDGLMYVLTGVACLFVLFISGKYTGFRFTLNFLDVYDIRGEAATYQIPQIFSYALSMMALILATLLLFWLQKKQYVIASGIIIVYLFLFSIAAHKSVFLFLILAFGSYIFYQKWMLYWMPGLLVGVTGAAVLEYKIIGTFYLANLFFRRMMYTPVGLSEVYYSYFRENPVSLFRDRIMGKLSFDGIYSLGSAALIGEYAKGKIFSANNGLVGDMLANLPILVGLVLMPLILIVCFRLLDMVAYDQETKIILPFCVYFASSFMNSSWSTVLLSHGLLITCLLLYIFPRKDVGLK